MSLLTEGVFAAADLVLVPTIPTVLSLRTLAQLIAWTGRGDRTPALVAFLSMVDRRKALHRRTCDWSTRHPELFLSGQVGYSSLVEQMAVRREPLPVFAPDDAASAAFGSIRTEVLTRLRHAGHRDARTSRAPALLVREIESVIAAIESADPGRGGRPARLTSRRGRQKACRWFTGSTPPIATSSVEGTCSSSTRSPGIFRLVVATVGQTTTMTARGRVRACPGSDRRPMGHRDPVQAAIAARRARTPIDPAAAVPGPPRATIVGERPLLRVDSRLAGSVTAWGRRGPPGMRHAR